MCSKKSTLSITRYSKFVLLQVGGNFAKYLNVLLADGDELVLQQAYLLPLTPSSWAHKTFTRKMCDVCGHPGAPGAPLPMPAAAPPQQQQHLHQREVPEWFQKGRTQERGSAALKRLPCILERRPERRCTGLKKNYRLVAAAEQGQRQPPAQEAPNQTGACGMLWLLRVLRQAHVRPSSAPTGLLLNGDCFRAPCGALRPPQWVQQRLPRALLQHLMPQLQQQQHPLQQQQHPEADGEEHAARAAATDHPQHQQQQRMRPAKQHIYTPLSHIQKSDVVDVYCVYWEMRRAPQETDTVCYMNVRVVDDSLQGPLERPKAAEFSLQLRGTGGGASLPFMLAGSILRLHRVVSVCLNLDVELALLLRTDRMAVIGDRGRSSSFSEVDVAVIHSLNRFVNSVFCTDTVFSSRYTADLRTLYRRGEGAFGDVVVRVVKASFGPALAVGNGGSSTTTASSSMCCCSYWLLVEDASWVGGGVAVASVSSPMLQHLASYGDSALQQGEWLRLRNVSFSRQDLTDKQGRLLAALGWTAPDRAQQMNQGFSLPVLLKGVAFRGFAAAEGLVASDPCTWISAACVACGKTAQRIFSSGNSGSTCCTVCGHEDLMLSYDLPLLLRDEEGALVPVHLRDPHGFMFSVFGGSSIAPPAPLLRQEARSLLLSLFRLLAFPYQLQTLPIFPSTLPTENCSGSKSTRTQSASADAFAAFPYSSIPTSNTSSSNCNSFSGSSSTTELERLGRRQSFLLRLVGLQQSKEPQWIIVDPSLHRHPL
ncbi:hypothetical protein cyc_02798 [Cyclospora cayetanensis]|uniref:Uncharacterized protein n=1 Tax=Cyclospora cayetanensis TaxID=88456 RepID=A0A1D3DAX0_9EIME|nr:hypothetical protein cyc_02798 [Cyclospora cayetanensis]